MKTCSNIVRRLLVLALVAAAVAHGSPAGAVGTGNSVTVWNKYAVDVVVGIAKKPGAAAMIDLTIVHAAIYDAVNAIDGGRFKAYASTPSVPQNASVDAAVGQAAHDVLRWLYPGQAEKLDADLATALLAIPDGPEKDAGTAAGAAAADAVIVLRTNDGRNDLSVIYIPPSRVSAWEPTPPAQAPAQTPWVGTMKPFTMTAPSQFRPVAPPAVTSTEYAKAVNETRSKGVMVGSTRTDADTAQALFWAEHFATQYNRYLRDLTVAQQLSTADSARLFAAVTMTAADSLIACWDGKFTYGLWRPITAIRNAAIDGNPDTAADPLWTPLLATPNHPEYPSAHACGSSAIAETLAAFFGTDRVRSTITSTTDITPRTFETFRDLYADVHDSRIFAGLHYRFSMNAGRVVGTKVSRQLTKKYFSPVQ
ncbi:MAG TPA: vanadium-dependent haloperoxidase [Vicinamibacterales bacterium]|nr:vanadium-dependent haloperoxidase [Vicinamibacterales bacterium]